MSDDKQLTVAELLARAGGEGAAAGSGSGRRRHRSIDQGGISVAELTGSMARVTDKPVEPRHSSVPMDTEESLRAPHGHHHGGAVPPAQQAPPAVEQVPQPAHQPTPQQVQRPAPGGASRIERPRTQPQPQAQPHSYADNQPAVTQVPAGTAPAQPPPGQRPSPWPIPQRTPGTAPTPPAPRPESSPRSEHPAVINGMDRGLKSSARAEQRVQQAQARASATALRASEQQERHEDQGVGADETGRIPRVPDGPDASASADARQEDAEQYNRALGETDTPSVESYNVHATAARPHPAARPHGERDLVRDSDEDAEGASGGLGGAILLAVVGVVLGAIVFLAFKQLWDSGMSRIMIGLAALAVTAVMVAGVHFLRTARDSLSMVLAAVVGLAMTFGPYVPTILGH